MSQADSTLVIDAETGKVIREMMKLAQAQRTDKEGIRYARANGIRLRLTAEQINTLRKGLS